MQTLPVDHRLKWIRIAGWVAIAGAFVGMVGDYCLLYAPEGGYMKGDYAFLRSIPNSRLLWGHYLGILAIPLEAAGLYVIWLGLLPVGRKTAFAGLIAGFYLMFMGVAYHGGVYPMADAVRMGNAQVEAFRPFNEPLGLGFAAAFLAMMVLFTLAIIRGKTAFPKWTAAFSPLMGYGMVMTLYGLVPGLGNFLAPMGFNLSMAIFYGALLCTAKHWNAKLGFH